MGSSPVGISWSSLYGRPRFECRHGSMGFKAKITNTPLILLMHTILAKKENEKKEYNTYAYTHTHHIWLYLWIPLRLFFLAVCFFLQQVEEPAKTLTGRWELSLQQSKTLIHVHCIYNNTIAYKDWSGKKIELKITIPSNVKSRNFYIVSGMLYISWNDCSILFWVLKDYR